MAYLIATFTLQGGRAESSARAPILVCEHVDPDGVCLMLMHTGDTVELVADETHRSLWCPDHTAQRES